MTKPKQQWVLINQPPADLDYNEEATLNLGVECVREGVGVLRGSMYSIYP